jgi:capsular exopolysaccharide synthesis family protein
VETRERRAAAPFESPAPHGSAEASLFDVWAIVRRRKGLILFGLVLGLGLATLYFFKATPQYESEAQILVVQKDANLPARGVEADQFGRDSSYQDLLATHVELLQSVRIIGDAVQKHQLDKLPTFQQARGDAEHFDPIGFVKKNLTVTKGGQGQAKDARVLKATFRGPSPDDCAAVLDAIVGSYQDFLGQTFRETSSEAVQLITQAKEELRKDLTIAEAGYQEFREKAPLFWEGDKGINPHQENMRQLEKSLLEVRLRRTDVTSRLEVIEEVMKGEGAQDLADIEKLALISGDDVERLGLMLQAARRDTASEAFLSEQPVRSEIAQTEFERLLSLLLEERRLLADYGSDHPEVKKIRSQLETAKAYVESKGLPEVRDAAGSFKPADLLEAQVGMLRHDLAELDRREKQLLALAEDARSSAKLLINSEIQNEMLRADITRKRELFDAIVDRLSEISLIQDFGGYITEVIAPVEVPLRATSPVLVLVLGLGGIFGLFFGSGLAYLVDVSDRTFRNPDEVRHALGLPLMGVVPAIRPAKRKAAASRNGKPASPIAQTMVAYHRPRSHEAEAFRGLRTALHFGTRCSGQKVIQITSPSPKDGKTTITANLAVSLAQSGKTVLVVDADLRNPTQHKLFGIAPKVGLSDVIVGDVELSDAIQGTGMKNLSLLPCGPCPPNPAELLASAAFEQFLEMAREKYDYLLLDSPPLLAVSDPSIIAPRADGVLLAIRITKNGAPAAVQARRMLAGLGAEVLGLVIDGFQKDRHYGHDGYYGGKYGYGYGYYGYGYGNGSANGNGDYYGDDTTDEATVADICLPADVASRRSNSDVPAE